MKTLGIQGFGMWYGRVQGFINACLTRSACCNLYDQGEEGWPGKTRKMLRAGEVLPNFFSGLDLAFFWVGGPPDSLEFFLSQHHLVPISFFKISTGIYTENC